TVYGKIKKIVKSNGTVITYGYDPGGERTSKTININDTITTTFYVRDAQGNVFGVYTQKDEAALKWSEQHLYGSGRLGIFQWDTIIPDAPPVVVDDDPIYDSLMLGSRTYELSNHLGNVLSTISDKKIGHDNSGAVDYYIAEVLSQNDYYPFGMIEPARKYEAKSYRYSVNGQEKERDINNNVTSAEFWMYDSRVGRRWNLDPKPTVAISPYSTFYDSPIWFTDKLGDSSVIDDRGYIIHYDPKDKDLRVYM